MKWLTALVSACLLALPAAAHDLRVFAAVDGNVVTVETKFSSGKVPVAGEIRVLDATGKLLLTLPIGQGGLTNFDLPDGVQDAGLMIEVEASEGHEDYWLLTPEDIAAGQKAK